MSTGLIICISIVGLVLIGWGIKTKSFTKVLAGISAILSSMVFNLTKKTNEQKQEIEKQRYTIDVQNKVVQEQTKSMDKIEETTEEIKEETQSQIEEVRDEKSIKGQTKITNNIINNFNNRSSRV